MMNHLAYEFSSGLELANLIVSSEDVLRLSLDAISDLHRHSDDPSCPISLKHRVYQYPPNTIIAFVSSPPCSTAQQFLDAGADMVSLEELRGGSSALLGTEFSSSFSVSKSAAALFSSVQDELSILKQQYGRSRPLIITGHSLGGSVASLFTLWLLDSNSFKGAKPPLCVTFGSPLLGNNAYRRGLVERSRWNACFLHVVSNEDPIPKLFLSSQNPSEFKPLGTFLIFSETGCACFEEPEAIVCVLKALDSNCVGNHDQERCPNISDYGGIIENLVKNAVCRGTSHRQPGDNVVSQHRWRRSYIVDPLQAELTLQLHAVGITRLQPQQERATLSSLTSIIKKRVESHLRRKRIIFKLNEMKIQMAYLEWYKKVTADQGGYYDCYKNTNSRSKDEVRSREEIVKSKRILSQYWKRVVAEAEEMPQKEEASLRTRWLFAATNCRRMIEPLDIAEYYMKGNRDYVTLGRPQHYILLEQWFNEDMSSGTTQVKERNSACSLTEDSCFWAHLEEAIMSCEVLEDSHSSPESRESSRDNLIRFEQYAMDQINQYAVSPEIFRPGSSFMRWWHHYYQIMGASFDSPLTDFMKNYIHEYA